MLDGIKKQMADFQPKKLPEVKKQKGRAKRYFILIALLALVGAGFYGAYKINQFFDSHKLVFQTPVQSPVLIVKREIPVAQATSSEVVIDPKELSEKDLVLSQENGGLLWRVYGIESQFGKLDNCRKSGLFNGFGFKQNSKQWVCYKTFDEVVTAADQWFTDHKDMGVPQSLCYYNLGQQVKNCDYYQKYLNIKIQ